jgi:hypothetical protein
MNMRPDNDQRIGRRFGFGSLGAIQQLQQTGILFMQTQQTQPASVMAIMQSQLA